jgi:hypothetical protein
MTTEVIVKANHGWPVDVTRTHVGTLKPMYNKERVPAGVTRTFSVSSGQDLLIHEVQPSELAAEAAAEAEAAA